MNSVRDRALSIVELLVPEVRGLPMSEIADRLGIPRTATHRLLADLREMGYVRQDPQSSRYFLTVRLAALGQAYLAATGISDLAQPLLDDLAQGSGELVRLAVSDGRQLVWVAKAQGARTGLRLDPDAGMQAYLPASATGLAWLAAMGEDEALQWIAAQGMEQARQRGPGAPRSVAELLERITETRDRGYGMVADAYEAGISAIAAVVRRDHASEPLGTVSIAGPSARMTPQRMKELTPQLLACARDLGLAGIQRFAPQTATGP